VIYLLRGLYDTFFRSTWPVTGQGQWWFEAQTPVDWEPAIAVAAVIHDDDDDDDDDGTLPAGTGHDRPRCSNCKGPNFSPEGDKCLACRLGM
jgi:hypothetical protein